MANSQLFLILVLGMVAAVILFRLYWVLGRRTGSERPPGEKWRFRRLPDSTLPAQQTKSSDNVIALPPRAAAASNDPVARGLMDIRLADQSFETEHFLSGARKAYEMIVIAYASGDRETLRSLLSDEVLAAFESVMAARESRHEKVSFSFVGFKNVKIVHAELRGRSAEITVDYDAQYVSVTTDPDGAVVEGDSKAVRDVVDHWSFAHDLNSGDPNWILVATSGGDGA